MFGEEEEEEKPKRQLIKLQYTEEEQRAMEAAQKQVDCHLFSLWPAHIRSAYAILLDSRLLSIIEQSSM